VAIEVKNNDPAEAIRELLRSILDKGLASAILVPQEIPSKQTVVQTLVRDSSRLESVNPLAPVFGVNSARIVAKMCVALLSAAPVESAMQEQPEPEQAEQPEQTKVDNDAEEQAEQASEKQESQSEEAPAKSQSAPEEEPAAGQEQSTASPIALVLRPCEIRALVELVKLQQVDLSPFLVIGVDCWGTYSIQDYAAKVKDGSGDSVTADFLKQVTSGKLPDELRGACRFCQFPTPTYADIVIRLIGEDINKQISLGAGTEKGKELLDALGLEDTPQSQGQKDAVEKLKAAKKKIAEQNEVDFLETISSLCINCRNCRAVCPICYCKQCVFDGEVFKYPLEKYLNWSGKKGVLPMPPDKLLFHLTRMSHVATSCAACGQCEAACPSGIPLGRIYQKISAAAQEALEYEAGRSLDEELPLTTFREDELSVVED
jgi:formate dehydrogenase subunit beta